MNDPNQADGEAMPEDKAISSQAKWNNANPKALWAHAALRSAIRKGLIERQPCEICGAEPADGHHHDYDRPMQVRWLCRLHHRQEHQQNRNAPQSGKS